MSAQWPQVANTVLVMLLVPQPSLACIMMRCEARQSACRVKQQLCVATWQMYTDWSLASPQNRGLHVLQLLHASWETYGSYGGLQV